MSKPELPTDVRVAIELFAEAQAERMKEMTSERLDDTLRTYGVDPDDSFIEDLLATLPPEPGGGEATVGRGSVDETAERARGQAVEGTFVPADEERRWPLRMSRVAWGALALAAAVAIALALPKLRDVWNGGPPPVAERDAGPPVPEPESPEREAIARAAALRDEAAHECDQERWRECEQSLDEARNIDPGGESREDVMSMRQGIARATRPLEQKAPPRAWPAPSPSTTRSPSQDRRHLDTKPGLSP